MDYRSIGWTETSFRVLKMHCGEEKNLRCWLIETGAEKLRREAV